MATSFPILYYSDEGSRGVLLHRPQLACVCCGEVIMILHLAPGLVEEKRVAKAIDRIQKSLGPNLDSLASSGGNPGNAGDDVYGILTSANEIPRIRAKSLDFDSQYKELGKDHKRNNKNTTNNNNRNRNNNYHQQQNRRQETARANAAAPTENRGYVGNLQKCNYCNFQHSGRDASNSVRDVTQMNWSSWEKDGIADERSFKTFELSRLRQVFPDVLSGLLLVRRIEFRIDLIPGASPVVKSPYRLAPSEMRWIELLSDYECEIKYHSGKANVVANALSRKEGLKPRRVRAMSITIHYGLKTKILEAQGEASKDLNAPAEWLRGLET
ncbi:hypothetical protein Tco_0766395 [Tanacetum coccineum]